MAQCLYGTQVKSGAPVYVWVAWNSFLSWLATHYSRLGVLTQIWFADVPLLVTDMCAEEPVIPPFPSVATWALALSGDGIASLELSNYLRTLFISTVWTTVCECAPSTGTGVCSPRLAPATTWSSQTAGGTNEVGNEFSCLTTTTFYGADYWRNAADTFASKQLSLWDQAGGPPVAQQTFSVAVGYNELLFTAPVVLTAGHTYSLTYCLGSGETNNRRSGHPANDAHISYVQPVNNNAVCNALPNTGEGGGGNWYNAFPICCVGGGPDIPGPPYSPPAPVDPTDIPDNPSAACSTTLDLCTATTRILSAVATAERQINWVQSALAPNCWVPGTTSTGLVGTGTLAVSDIVGVFVDCSVPMRWGRSSETPARYIPEIGSVEFTTDGVATVRYGLHYAQENIIRGVPSNNGIRYNIRGGVVVSITPLHRCK